MKRKRLGKPAWRSGTVGGEGGDAGRKEKEEESEKERERKRKRKN